MAKRILLIDESPTIRKIVELTFRETGVQVDGADSGASGLDAVETFCPDLVLADVALEPPTGYEICRSVKASSRPVPVILLAGTFQPFDAELARDCGADANLVKPFEAQHLRLTVEQLLEESAVESTASEVAAIAEAPAPIVEDSVDEPALPADTHEVDELSAVLETPTGEVSPDLVDAVARAVVERLSHDVVREIAREVVPEIAASLVRERIRELENED